jgi:hypothetical protein
MTENFILQEYLDDLSICDSLIEIHKNSTEKEPGIVFTQGMPTIKPDIKDSTDISLPVELGGPYVVALQKIVEKYIKKYPYCNKGAPWKIVSNIPIQHYKPNQGYFVWHDERNNATHPTTTRHLVFMTYLNDVTDGGETEFLHQKLKIQPRKGLTLIWPADWTYTHRGITSPTQEKYIITGWFNYV